MKPSQNCIDLIKHFEGCRLKPYLCSAGVPTIGYGHTRTVNLDSPPITQEKAEELLSGDLYLFAGAVEFAVRLPLMEQHEFDALVSFAFNCKGWQKSTLVKLLNQAKTQQAADEFPKWVYAAGKKLPGLVRRRAAEQKLFLTGELEIPA